jgi:inhibitor of cysteine peptidase
VGDTVEVQLEGNPTTGYTWEISQVDSKILGLIGKSYTQTRTDPKVAGTGGTFIFRIHACDKGTSELHLQYARVWEKGVPPIKTFDATITVK